MTVFPSLNPIICISCISRVSANCSVAIKADYNALDFIERGKSVKVSSNIMLEWELYYELCALQQMRLDWMRNSLKVSQVELSE